MFGTILIANRGEIACRIMRTARRLGVRTIAVYSEADAEALHVDLADEAYLIGGAAAADSYLVAERIIEVARQSGAEAIHPGYGFLAENADFAEACEEAGFVFIGPPAAAIRAMGAKDEAKARMEQAGVPAIPGYHGAAQDDARLAREAKAIGYPVLLKPAAGGGGKGMRVVEKAGDLAEALAGARREAQAAFGDQRMLVEKYLTRPRHVEVQVFADRHGNCVHLFERDCSLQRRHQKVVEEAPAPGLDAALRRHMGEAAVAAARAVDYAGAGTVEFLLDEDGSFFFMEMNTRLQVEHPVTEMVTGLDLVEWQLRIAAGDHLPWRQDDLAIHGHAVEVRLYAEEPARGFLPATGRLGHLRLPDDSPQVRVDSGVRGGGAISVHYDPLIAKIIAWGRDREGALRRLAAALAETQVTGVATNLAFLTAVVAHDAFVAGDVDTGFIDRHRAELVFPRRRASDTVLALACLEVLLRRAREAADAARRSGDPHSPWHETDGWRLNDDNHHDLLFADGDDEVTVTVHYRHDGFFLDLPGGDVLVSGSLEPGGELVAVLAGRRLKATVIRHDHDLVVLTAGDSHCLTIVDPAARSVEREAPPGGLTAPMPGKIVAISVEPGQNVAKGQALLVLEAMKMEHTITAPAAGTIDAVHYRVGDQVEEGVELLGFEPAD